MIGSQSGIRFRKLLWKIGLTASVVFGFQLQSIAQQYSGRVVDSLNREPLAFVNIIYNNSQQGVVTNLDGYFTIPPQARVQFLKMRYVGYKTRTFSYLPRRGEKIPVFYLNPEPLGIAEVVVYPTENPAHRIIRLATANRDANHPEKGGAFSYIAYDKLVFGFERDSLIARHGMDSATGRIRGLPDSLEYGMDRKGRVDMQRFIDDQYLFMMESISQRKFQSPGRNREEIIASRVSGLTQPSFVAMARQFQSFSFYDNFVQIANQQLLNPISPGSTGQYFFLIQDTLFTSTNDTVFIISFRPKKGKNFSGMKGVLYINSNGYAVQNVIAEADQPGNSMFRVSIQQQYEFIENRRWFPVQLNTSVVMNSLPVATGAPPVSIIGSGRSYLVNIDFNPVFDKDDFSSVQLEVKPDAHKQPEALWDNYRVDSLSDREKETYRVIDSIGKAENIDRTIASFETILTGYIPGKYVALNIARFIDFNPHEGFRLGVGGKTTPQVLKHIELGGYIAYGFRDRKIKYSAEAGFQLFPKHELMLGIRYTDDVREAAGITFNESLDLSGSAFIRNYMIEVMDQVREAETSLQFRLFKYLAAKAWLNLSHVETAGGYGYQVSDLNPQVTLTSFNLADVGVRFRYAYGETFMKTPRGNRFSLGTKYPVVYLNLARGFESWWGEFGYWRGEIKITKTFRTKRLGDTRLAWTSGLVSGEIPYSRYYTGPGSYRPFGVEAEQSFGTMRLNEFLSDRFTSVFIKQDLGNLLFKPRGNFKPEIALVHNLGFGWLHDRGPLGDIPLQTLEKGYFEGGLLINNLVRLQILQYGLAVFYRYGPYAFPETIDNFAFKLTLRLSI